MVGASGVRRVLPLVLLALAAAGRAHAAAPVCGYAVVDAFPHDPGAFTQGLVWDAGELLEGTGLYGFSSLRRVDPVTGAVLQQVDLPAHLFGEGVAVVGETVLQVTWQEHQGLRYRRADLAPLAGFTYPGQGWGLAFDGRRVVLSDGSATLRLLDPDTLEQVGSLEVRDGERPVTNLNELEWVSGELFANVWLTDVIARIDPVTGQVTAWIDLAGLLASQGVSPSPGVLNGIAWDPVARRLFVTGKNWPWLFEIDLPDCPIDGLFADGFELGDTSRWSGPSPAPRTAPRLRRARLRAAAASPGAPPPAVPARRGR